MNLVLDEVRRRLQQREISTAVAAREIGVTEQSLRRHLEGGYVRSDSVAKYRQWLAGEGARSSGAKARSRQANLFEERVLEENGSHLVERPEGGGSFRIVDLFSGCGGLSLGFEISADRQAFHTTLAIDIEDAMVTAFNANHPSPPAAEVPICRRVDISEFLNEAEVLAFYLDHCARLGDACLRRELESLSPIGLSRFGAWMARIDSAFLRSLGEIRGSQDYRNAFNKMQSQALSQTSVIGFHDALKLPLTSLSRSPLLGPLLWSRSEERDFTDSVPYSLENEYQALSVEIRGEFDVMWRREVERLERRMGTPGKGQLASSAGRIAAFVTFLSSETMGRVRDVWLDWRSRRDALRFLLFRRSTALASLQRMYSGERQVAVLLGGPPCQGFSRIGRGKLRSLREGGIHVHYDELSGDIRNLLLHKYVLFVAALQPAAFLFENVRHFQTEVRTPGGTFLASDVLADAIRDVADGGVSYRVAHRIILASRHLVPQNRERFFMVGFRADISGESTAEWCLSLPVQGAVPVRSALAGLPEPFYADQRLRGAPPLARTVRRNSTTPGDDPSGRFRRWVEQSPPAYLDRALGIDAHCARPARDDDAEFFALLGPGKRWMDYRCDNSATVTELRDLLGLVARLRKQLSGLSLEKEPEFSEPLAALDPDRIARALNVLDGSLSLRLLLEEIESLPGHSEHHLLNPNYLHKADGNHGDWLARLHPDEPSKTIVTHMGKDTYAYVHPSQPRTLSVREAARVQTFPDWFRLGDLSLVDGFRVVGNAVPPLLSYQFAERVASVLWSHNTISSQTMGREINVQRPNLENSTSCLPVSV